MSEQVYIQKPRAVLAQVITLALLEQLKEEEPGLVKYASAGDYLVTEGTRREVVSQERFGAEFEKESDQPGARAVELLEQALASQSSIKEALAALELKIQETADASSDGAAKLLEHLSSLVTHEIEPLAKRLGIVESKTAGLTMHGGGNPPQVQPGSIADLGAGAHANQGSQQPASKAKGK